MGARNKEDLVPEVPEGSPVLGLSKIGLLQRGGFLPTRHLLWTVLRPRTGALR